MTLDRVRRHRVQRRQQAEDASCSATWNRKKGKRYAHSSQFGLLAIVAVICLFSALRVGLLDVSSKITSCRLEGGRVKTSGMDMFVVRAVVICLGQVDDGKLGGD